MGDDRLVEVLLAGTNAKGVEVVQQPPRLVLLGVEPGETQQAPRVVTRVDDLGLDPDVRGVVRRLDVELGDIEAERVESAYPALDTAQLGPRELLDAGQLGPQLAVAGLDHVHEVQRVEALLEHAAGLQVAEVAEQVGPGDDQVVLSLAGGQRVMQLAGLGVDEVRGERPRIAAEQRVRQRHVAPEEADDVQPREQYHHGVDQAADRVLLHARGEQ